MKSIKFMLILGSAITAFYVNIISMPNLEKEDIFTIYLENQIDLMDKQEKNLNFKNNVDGIEVDNYFIINKGYEFDVEVEPSITYEMQKKEIEANTGLIVKVGSFDINSNEFNQKNLDIYGGLNSEGNLFSVVPPITELSEYPAKMTLNKINTFSYSPFYFNSKSIQINSNNEYRVYLYNLEQEIIGAVLSENGEVEINTELLDSYYILICNDSDSEFISLELEIL